MADTARTKRRIGRNKTRANSRGKVTDDKPNRSRTKKAPPATNSKDTEALKERLAELAKGIDDRRVEIEVRQTETAAMQAEAKEIMETLNLTEFDVPRVGMHEIVTPMGKKSTKIDVRKFQKKVTKDQFLDSVSVTQKAAKEVLPTKVVEEITDETPGKKGDPVYKFTPAGSKK